MPEGPTYTITEAARLVGIEPKAMRRRTERGTVRTELETRGGKPVKVIRGDELVRVGLLVVQEGEDMPAPPAVPTMPPSRAQAVLDGSELLDRYTSAISELATVRLLEAQAGERERSEREAREQAEGALHRERAASEQARAERDSERQARQEAEARAARLADELAARDEPAPAEPAPAPEPEARPGLWARFLGRVDPPG